MKKRIVSGLLCLCFFACCLLFAGCATIDTTGLLAAAEGLITESAELNEIFYGEGIPYIKDDVNAMGVYCPADPEYLDRAGFHTVAEMKEKTLTVFSTAYAEIIFSSSIEGFAAEGGYIYARYASNQTENLRDENETVMVNSEHTGTAIGVSTYDFSSMRITETKKDYATVTLSVTTVFSAEEEGGEPYTLTEDMNIRFVYENGWRIDSRTY